MIMTIKEPKATVEIIRHGKAVVIARDRWISPRINKVAQACFDRGIPFGLGYSNSYSADVLWQTKEYADWFMQHPQPLQVTQ